MHKWVLIDVIELFEGKEHNIFPVIQNVFVGHGYLLFCVECETTRVVKESTFNKMVKLGLIEEQV